MQLLRHTVGASPRRVRACERACGRRMVLTEEEEIKEEMKEEEESLRSL